ncbi:hypothetical protein [Dyadobacter sp. CY356]|uniref:hypothetical protein n=1 Tax=Dyadobacter sp. CY356 TaxID=2906442 RepID=UPI001F2D6F79|nr:hypothetical protein [Dyadobacter sp. CY356]MCF0057942.1 hypothetical protein [Dyadobacter sp. CY356]
MKKYIFLFFAVSNSVAFGQSKTVCRSVATDGNALSIHMSGNIDGEEFDFDHTFDISSLDKIARLVFKDKILDSLDVLVAEIPEHTIPTVPIAAKPPKAPKSEVTVDMEETSTSDNHDNNNRPAAKKPFSKQIKYNAAGEMYMHYQFIKNGEDFEYERTLNANGKSEAERQRIITETEKEIGFSTGK